MWSWNLNLDILIPEFLSLIFMLNVDMGLELDKGSSIGPTV